MWLKCRWQPSIFSTVKKETLEYDMPFSSLLLLEGITVALATRSDSGSKCMVQKIELQNASCLNLIRLSM